MEHLAKNEVLLVVAEYINDLDTEENHLAIKILNQGVDNLNLQDAGDGGLAKANPFSDGASDSSCSDDNRNNGLNAFVVADDVSHSTTTVDPVITTILTSMPGQRDRPRGRRRSCGSNP